MQNYFVDDIFFFVTGFYIIVMDVKVCYWEWRGHLMLYLTSPLPAKFIRGKHQRRNKKNKSEIKDDNNKEV